jgi:nicotinamidase-related amidase
MLHRQLSEFPGALRAGIHRRLMHSLPTLIIIDVQQGFAEQDAAGHRRNNPEALERIVDLLAAFRAKNLPVFHIRHASTEPDSVFRPERTGFHVIPAARELPGEPVIVKTVNSAFIGTELEAQLWEAGRHTLVICGATTNHCVETSTRMAGNLGFDARLVRDATWTYDRTGPDGDHQSAAEIHAMTLSNLSGEFATVVTTQEILAEL